MTVTFDQDTWSFQLSNSSTVERLTGQGRPDTLLNYSSIGDFMRLLADDENDLFARLHGPIIDRISKSPIVAAWKAKRAHLKDLKHFPQYRRRAFDLYHDAARAVAAGTADEKQLALVEGLAGEIAQSQIIIPAGQILFHGRADWLLAAQRPYPTFVSTSLHPVVARNRAFARTGIDMKNGKPLVCVLELKAPLPAMWGHVGKSQEYELLLTRNLTFKEVDRYAGTKFEVAHLDVTS
ncbi:hypothetical protein [Bradyrhizobium sp. BWA-3-5]|uniref:hypothetical protein n=1 Tax=Bradyrhizobium sp. BWA-3-5 TaxID=3080013 RepID=UPI00293F55AB|nr:hypothetical protein [Bradyrhizobium sp. BWA-3-5]WOH66163.1 hypothetical protein RX331_37575 [Bradyrhizobium sp. BWA-3-5]